ncbi:hypothetical protein SH139x_002370 [Planctomycetaceae bacterium SH139]
MNAVRFGLLILISTAVSLPLPVCAQRSSSPNAARQQAARQQHGDEVTRAVARGPADSERSAGQIRQVVDNSPGRGILGRIFNSGPSSSRTRPAKKDDGRRVIEAVGPSEPADWTGVPYHSPSPATAARDASPLNDPGSGSARVTQRPPVTRRTPVTQRSTAPPTASPIPVPRSQAEARASRRTAPGTSEVPTARPVSELNTSTFQPLSETESSRRSRRRSVEPLDIDIDNMPALDGADNMYGEASSSRRPREANIATATPEPSVTRRSLPPTSGQLPPAESKREIAQQAPAQQPAEEELAANEVAESNPEARVASATPQAPIKSTAKPAANPNTTANRVDSAPIEWRPANPASTDSVAQNSPGSSRRSVAQQPTLPNLSAPQFGTPAATAATTTAAAPPVGNPPPAENNPLVEDTPLVENNPLGSATARQLPTNDQPLSGPAVVNDLGVTPSLESRGTAKTDTAVNSSPVNVSSEIPGLRVVTRGPADIPVRHASGYEISVENLGSMAAPGAAIQVKLPTWIQLQNIVPSRGEIVRQDDAKERQLLWVVEGLAAGQVEKLSLQLVAQEAKQFDVDVEWAVVPQSNKARISVREPALQLIIDGPEQITYGTSETYTVRVLNPGNGPASNVVFTLSPNSATPQTQRVTEIEPGKEAKFEVELTARDLEDLQIHGLATADLNLKQEEIKLIKVVSAKLQAVLTGPPVKYQDAMAEYRLQISNTGNAVCTNAQALLELPSGLKYLSGLETATVARNQIQWQIASLEPGQTVDFVFRCQMQQTGQHRLQFSCRGSAAGVTTVEFDTRVEALADLVLTIDDPVAPAPVGEEVVYEITILNRGSKAADQVSLLAQFSHDIEPIRIEGATGTIEPGQVKFNEVATLEAGKSLRLKVFAKAEKPGHHRFRAEVTCGDTLLVAEEATRYLELGSQRVSRRSDDPVNDR